MVQHKKTIRLEQQEQQLLPAVAGPPATSPQRRNSCHTHHPIQCRRQANLRWHVGHGMRHGDAVAAGSAVAGCGGCGRVSERRGFRPCHAEEEQLLSRAKQEGQKGSVVGVCCYMALNLGGDTCKWKQALCVDQSW